MIDPTMLHFYRQVRRLRDDPYGRPALTAWLSAKRAIHFRATLAADVAAYRRRSKAARKGWKTRRANGR